MIKRALGDGGMVESTTTAPNHNTAVLEFGDGENISWVTIRIFKAINPCA